MTPDYEIVFGNRGDAQKVLDEMCNILCTYGFVTVADLYDLSDLHPNYICNKYGWTNLSKAYIMCTPCGYHVVLPRPFPIDMDDRRRFYAEKKDENKMAKAVLAIEHGLIGSGLNWSVSYNHETKSYHVYISEPEEDANG